MLLSMPRPVRTAFVPLALAVALSMPGAAGAQETAPDRHARVKTDEAEANGVVRLVDDRVLLLDEFGRVPLLRITFASGAELPSTFEIPERDEPFPFFQENLLMLVGGGTVS